jgi:hypothetical protein
MVSRCAALSWFKDHFLRCNDRTALVKTWLPAQYTGPSTWVDELVYNRALTLVFTPPLPFFHTPPCFSYVLYLTIGPKLFFFAEPDRRTQGASRSAQVARRMRAPLRRVALVSLRAAGRPVAEGQPVHAGGPRDDCHVCVYFHRRRPPFFFLVVLIMVNRDQADKVASCAVPCAHGDA